MTLHRLHDSIYQADISLLVGPFTDLAPMLRRRGYDVDDDEAPAQGKTFESRALPARWLVWLPPDVTLSTLVHECVHLAAHVLRDRDVALTRASEEAYAYYVSSMFEQMQHALQIVRRPSTKKPRGPRAK